MGEGAAARTLAPASLRRRGLGYTPRYPTLPPLPLPPGAGKVSKSRSHMRSCCVLFNCVTSTLKTDGVALVHLLVQVVSIRSVVATVFRMVIKLPSTSGFLENLDNLLEQ